MFVFLNAAEFVLSFAWVTENLFVLFAQFSSLCLLGKSQSFPALLEHFAICCLRKVEILYLINTNYFAAYFAVASGIPALLVFQFAKFMLGI